MKTQKNCFNYIIFCFILYILANFRKSFQIMIICLNRFCELLKLFWRWLCVLANQLFWHADRYTTQTLKIPWFGVANYERFAEDIRIMRPLMTPEGFIKQFHHEINDLANQRYPNLRELKIYMCGLRQVPRLPTRCLNTLFITHNEITHLPEDLPDTITDLFLFRNDLRKLPAQLPKNLRKLNIACNPNLVIPATYCFPDSLEELICHGCHLTNLPDQLPKSLRRLICDTNQLTRLPQELPLNMKVLTCSHNRISRLPKLPPNLIELRCTDNPDMKWLPEIPDKLIDIATDFSIYPAYAHIIPRDGFRLHHKGFGLTPGTKQKMNDVSRCYERMADMITPEFHAARERILNNPRRVARLISTGELDITIRDGWDE